MDDTYSDSLPAPDLGEEFLRDQRRKDRSNRIVGLRLFWCSVGLYLGVVAATPACLFGLETFTDRGLGAFLLYLLVLLGAASGVSASVLVGLFSLVFYRGRFIFLCFQTSVILAETITALFLLFFPMFTVTAV